MEVQENQLDGLKRQFKVNIPSEQIQKAVDQKLKYFGSNAKIPGFRKGKVPAKILKAKYGAHALQEAANDLLNETSKKVINDKGLRTAQEPQIKVTNFDTETPSLEYEINCEVLPTIPEIDASKISVEKIVTEVSDKDADDEVKKVHEKTVVYKDAAKTKKAALGDAIKGKIVFELEGKEEKGDEKEQRIILAEENKDEPIVKALVGAKAGDTVTVDLPDTTGKTKKMKTRCHIEVVKVQTPGENKFDDKLAQELGLETYAELQQKMKERLEKGVEGMSTSYMKRELLDHLDVNFDFDVPQSMLDTEFQNIWKQVLNELEDEGENKSQEELDEMKEEYKLIAERRVRLGLILAEAGNRAKLSITNQELNDRIMMTAYQMGIHPTELVKLLQKNNNALASIRAEVFEEKVVNWLLENVKVSEKKVKYADFEKTYEDKLESDMPKVAEAKKAKGTKGKAKKAEAPKAEKKSASKKTADEKPKAKKTASKKAAPKKEEQ